MIKVCSAMCGRSLGFAVGNLITFKIQDDLCLLLFGLIHGGQRTINIHDDNHAIARGSIQIQTMIVVIIINLSQWNDDVFTRKHRVELVTPVTGYNTQD